MDVLLLSRIQFAVTAAFHYIYPPMSIGLGLCLVLMEALYLKTRDPRHEAMTRFWVKIFGLTFALGVASGIVLEFEFGTNWEVYSRFVGDVFGSALASEAIFAFFLESGFLALLLFGWDRVRPGLHFFSTIMVCLGAHFSAVWILVANSWMQTPAGHHIVTEAGRTRAEIVDFWAMVFNPSTLARLSHTVIGCWLAGAFLVISVSAYYLLKKRHIFIARSSMRVGLSVALVAGVGALATGHHSAVVVARHQPAKLAAMEGHFEASAPADLTLLGWVDEANETARGPRIPGLLSRLVHGDPAAPVTGLKAFPEDERPPVQPVFQAFHFMVAFGLLMLALALAAGYLSLRGRLAETRWLLRLLVPAVVLPHLSNQLGWMVAEIGRQPWIVYGLLRTSESASRGVSAGQVWFSLTLFVTIYLALLFLFLYLLDHKIKQGPEPKGAEPDDEGRRRA